MKKILVILVMLVAMNVSGQWQPDVRLTNDPANSYTSFNNAWNVAANGNVVHVVWRDSRDGNFEIYYKRSTDDGTSWGADIRLTNKFGSSYHPSIVVSGSLVHVVWYYTYNGQNDIYYKRSTDSGTSWEADTRLTNNTFYSNGITKTIGRPNPSLAVSASFVHVVWQDPRNGNTEIYYKHSTDGGNSWGADTRLTDNPSNSDLPSIAVSGSLVNVVWADMRDGNYDIFEIYYKHSSDGGNSWGADIRLTNDSANSYSPCVSVSASLVHVVWHDRRDGNYEIYYKRSTDGGTSWGTDTRLTNFIYRSLYPSVAVSESLVHVVWEDERNGNSEIYYKRSTDDGISWGADTRLTNNLVTRDSPSLAVSGPVVHVIWDDYRDGNTINTEIYYKRNPTGNLVEINNISTETPSKYSLSQNYPNPFNPITNVKFSIVNSGDVKLIVYDIMGKEVQTLVNERLQPGTYEAAFDASSLNTGVYFYKLITGTFSETKKMLLIK